MLMRTFCKSDTVSSSKQCAQWSHMFTASLLASFQCSNVSSALSSFADPSGPWSSEIRPFVVGAGEREDGMVVFDPLRLNVLPLRSFFGSIRRTGVGAVLLRSSLDLVSPEFRSSSEFELAESDDTGEGDLTLASSADS